MSRPDASDQPQGDALYLLKDFYAAELAYLAAGGPGKASFDELAMYLDPDVVTYQGTSLPYGGTWRGHRGMQEHFAAMSQAWESFDILEQKYLDHGDTITVHSQIRARARATGIELDFPIVQLITIRDGRIIEFQQFYRDTVPIADACAHQRPSDTPS